MIWAQQILQLLTPKLFGVCKLCIYFELTFEFWLVLVIKY